MASAVSAVSTAQRERVLYNKLFWVGPLAIVASIIANLLVRIVTVALLNPDPAFQPLGWGPPIGLTFFGVLGAIIIYAIIGRFSRRPITLFRRIALVALIVSFVPDIALLVVPSQPGTTIGAVIALIVIHVVAWWIAVALLTRLAGEQ